jgi:1-deoxy-D-xylulose-5-phosphate reductoisomerase
MENLNLSPALEDILEVDNWARLFVEQEIKKGKKYVSIG